MDRRLATNLKGPKGDGSPGGRWVWLTTVCILALCALFVNGGCAYLTTIVYQDPSGRELGRGLFSRGSLSLFDYLLGDTEDVERVTLTSEEAAAYNAKPHTENERLSCLPRGAISGHPDNCCSRSHTCSGSATPI